MVKKVENMGDFEKELADAGSKLVVVDFTASWCGPCRMIAPKFEELAKNNPDVVFLKVDVDDCEDIAQQYEVSAMPTFKFFKNKEEFKDESGDVIQIVGANEAALKENVEKHK